ncbi:COMM domain-containing protein 3 [Periophthalmus magnuspinnatus]|uniref:COMM domain-containing protein 3 n=1 Tax=Periophthalmus magnuspinnatus TaxID=409849 RepID=UPI00145BCBDD|nr:COMM domain-containing protein 3 [Periophthalmus magnuspinnatus]
MELSESVQRGLKLLADPCVFEPRSFSVMLDVCFRSVLVAPGDASVLDHPELKNLDQILVKQSHTAVVTFILECVKLNTDKSTLSSCLEELLFSAERIEIFHSVYEKHKTDITRLLSCLGRRLPEINDVSWRLQYQIKSAQVDKVDEPFYLITLNTEKEAESSEDVNFSCTVEQLQDLVGKLKDAAKSLERAGQM